MKYPLMNESGVLWRAEAGQPIVFLDEASAWVENGLLHLRLGRQETPIVKLVVPLVLGMNSIETCSCTPCFNARYIRDIP